MNAQPLQTCVRVNRNTIYIVKAGVKDRVY